MIERALTENTCLLRVKNVKFDARQETQGAIRVVGSMLSWRNSRDFVSALNRVPGTAGQSTCSEGFAPVAVFPVPQQHPTFPGTLASICTRHKALPPLNDSVQLR
jgi:hypothetical protein